MSCVNNVKLPNVVVAGVNKAGTTSVFRYLAAHPDVCASSVKETCYFLSMRYGEDIAPLAQYSRLFSHCAGENIVMEATPGYFFGGADVASVIKSVLGEVKVILVLRDPVARFFSFFEFMKSSLLIDKSMDARGYYSACLAMSENDLKNRDSNKYFGLEGGCYAKYLPAWQDVFGSNLKIVFFDDLAASPCRVLEDLSAFLGIDPAPFSNMRFAQENKTRGFSSKILHTIALMLYKKLGVSKYPVLHKRLISVYYFINGAEKGRSDDLWLREELVRYYTEHNSGLFEMLNSARDIKKPFPAWVPAVTCEGT